MNLSRKNTTGKVLVMGITNKTITGNYSSVNRKNELINSEGKMDTLLGENTEKRKRYYLGQNYNDLILEEIFEKNIQMKKNDSDNEISWKNINQINKG